MCPGLGLDVGVLDAEQLLAALDGQRFDDVDKFTTAVVALSRVISHTCWSAACRPLPSPLRNKVFRSDRLNLVCCRFSSEAPLHKPEVCFFQDGDTASSTPFRLRTRRASAVLSDQDFSTTDSIFGRQSGCQHHVSQLPHRPPEASSGGSWDAGQRAPYSSLHTAESTFSNVPIRLARSTVSSLSSPISGRHRQPCHGIGGGDGFHGLAGDLLLSCW